MPPWMKNWICDPSFSRWMNDGRMVPTSTTPGKSSAFKNARKNKSVRRSEIFQALVVHDYTPVFSHPNLQDSLTCCCWASLVLCLLKRDFFSPLSSVCVSFVFFFLFPGFCLGWWVGGYSSSSLLQIWCWRSCAQKQRTKRRR